MIAMFVLSMALSEPTDDLKRDMKALEIFLQDKEDKQNFCPKLKWEQPDIEVYKETLKSHLPKDCKKT